MMKVSVMIAAAAVLGGLSVAAYAQRDPAYAAARAGGEVGEQPDGYLGLVGAASGDLRALVNNINIQRNLPALLQQQGAPPPPDPTPKLPTIQPPASRIVP